MKNIIISIWSLALLSFTISDTELTKLEREFAINELTNSRDHLLNALDGLSEEHNFNAFIKLYNKDLKVYTYPKTLSL